MVRYASLSEEQQRGLGGTKNGDDKGNEERNMEPEDTSSTQVYKLASTKHPRL